jgi:hypothetical protein
MVPEMTVQSFEALGNCHLTCLNPLRSVVCDMGFVTDPQRGSPLIPAITYTTLGMTGGTMLLGYMRVSEVDSS